MIGVGSLESTMDSARGQRCTVVVEPFTVPGVERGAHIADPTGVLVGLHETTRRPEARPGRQALRSMLNGYSTAGSGSSGLVLRASFISKSWPLTTGQRSTLAPKVRPEPSDTRIWPPQ